MKTKFYLLTTFMFFCMAVSAQKYQVATIQEWVNNAWADTSRTTNTYDPNGNLVKLTVEEWNGQTNTWITSATITHTLNSDATIKESLFQALNPETNTMENYIRMFYTYSASKKLMTAIGQFWFGVSWMDLTSNIFTYNDNDQLIRMLTQKMGINSAQINYSYNADGTKHQQVSLIWSLGEWQNTKQTTQTYNDAKLPISTLGEQWINDAWVNESRSTITYNAGGSITESKEETWMDTQWVNASKEMYSYNAKGEIVEVLSQHWNTAPGQWENQTRILYDYSSTGLNPIEWTGQAPLVFPNPFEDQLTIKFANPQDHLLQVFNAAGQLIKTVNSNQPVMNLNLKGQKLGTYFLKIKSSQNEQTIKIIKSR